MAPRQPDWKPVSAALCCLKPSSGPHGLWSRVWLCSRLKRPLALFLASFTFCYLCILVITKLILVPCTDHTLLFSLPRMCLSSLFTCNPTFRRGRGRHMRGDLKASAIAGTVTHHLCEEPHHPKENVKEAHTQYPLQFTSSVCWLPLQSRWNVNSPRGGI